jgi:nucleotide-binding universal stress UspA family protein
MKIWKAQKKPIVVGMRLDDHEGLLLQSTMSLAKKLQSCVELVHCFESPIGYSSAGEVSPKATSQGSLTNIWSEDRAHSVLKALASAANDHTNIHIHVERGDPGENLSRIAREVSAGLIVCGIRNQTQPWAFKGISTALSLAFYAPVPVLILPLTLAIDFQKPVNILIADNLGGEGWQVLEAGLQLARYLDCQSVYHSHVLKANELDILTTLQDMDENKARGQLPRHISFTPELMEKTLLQKINEELFYRFHNTSCCKDLLQRYHPVAAIGDIDAEVNRIIETNQTQLVIMGRHQFYSNRKLSLDHIPYHAIMKQKAGLLVIPGYEESRSRGHDNEWDSRVSSDMDLSDMPLSTDAF